MPKPTEYDKTHQRNLTAIGTRIDRIFKKAAEEAAKIGVSIKTALPDDKIFSFDDYPATKKQIERLMGALQESMQTTIVNGVRSAWALSNDKNDAYISSVFGEKVKNMGEEQRRKYFSNNANALDAFLSRQKQGLNLSDRVWKYTNAFKGEIELGLDLGIRSGESAAQMSRSLREYLRYPDKLFRRVRDEHGILRLSQAAKEFHPGRGVYRSSYKNARRLACTETNIAYRTSDFLRWQQMDFVVGIEIELSNNHTVNGRVLTDICDELAGRYPKDFKFTGWHPQCRCHAVPILKTEEEMAEDTKRILNGEQPTDESVNTVHSVPTAFDDWVEDNAEKIEAAAQRGTLPYFVRDNQQRVDSILGMSDNPMFATIVKVGEQEYTLKQLISECEVVETANGKVYVHSGHGKNELAENLEFARWRAEAFGEEVILLPNPQNVKSPDSYNITRGVMEEYKISSTPTKNSIDRLIRDGSKQADHLILEINSDISPETIQCGIKARVARASGLKEIRVKVGHAEAIYSREQILSKDFEIKPGDFRNASISRSGAEGSSERSADAKLQNFFGLNKKTPEEIAAKRHAERSPEAARIEANSREYERLKADPNYKDVKFNPENGGLKATHVEHEQHENVDPKRLFFGVMTPNDLEKECQDILFNSGFSCILNSEHIFDSVTKKQLKVLDTTINGKCADIVSITENGSKTIKNALDRKKKQIRKVNEIYGTEWDSVILHFHDPSFFNEDKVRKGLGKTFRHIICALNTHPIKVIIIE